MSILINTSYIQVKDFSDLKKIRQPCFVGCLSLFKLQIFLKLWLFLFIVFLQLLHQQGEVAEQGFCRESEYHHKQYADI